MENIQKLGSEVD